MTSSELQAAFGYLTEAELAGLKQLAQMLPDKNPRIINIGAGSGTSGLAFMESRHDMFLTTIDIRDEDNPFGCLYAERIAIEQADYGNVSGMLKRFTQIHEDSKIVGREFQDASFKVDCVFVDGLHSYRGAKGDILAWLPNIKPGGIMAVHDYDKKRVYASGTLQGKVMHPLPWPGVDRTVRKFLCPYFEIALHVDTLIAFTVTEDGVRRLNDTLG